MQIDRHRAMRLYIVDAFAERPFGGNTAGVVMVDGSAFPDDETMRLVAEELRYSETAFVMGCGDSEFTLRYFTPKGEVDLCGHATIAAFGALRKEGRAAKSNLCHTLADDIEVTVGDNVLMEMARPRLLEKELDTTLLYKIMGGEPTELPVRVVSTGLPDIMMPVKDRTALNALNPDMEALAKLSTELDVVGVHAFCPATGDYPAAPSACCLTRNFAPRYGIPEESATGTASGALTHYLSINGLLPTSRECTFVQGEKMGRPSVIVTRMADDGRVYVGGDSAIVAEGEIYL